MDRIVRVTAQNTLFQTQICLLGLGDASYGSGLVGVLYDDTKYNNSKMAFQDGGRPPSWILNSYCKLAVDS